MSFNFQEKSNILFILLVAAFIGFSLNPSIPLFRTPDEQCNYFFSLLYAKEGVLFYEYGPNTYTDNMIVPNGARILENGKIVPGKFIGLPMYYGTFVSILGTTILLFLTPLSACIGLLIVFCLGKELFGEDIALISSVLLVVFSPFWFWSTFPLFETIFGAIFFVFGLVYTFKIINKPERMAYYFLVALFMGVSFSIRPDITLLLIPLLFTTLLVKQLNIKYVIMCLFVFALVISPVLIQNYELYGDILTSGAAQNGDRFTSGGEMLLQSASAAERDLSAIVPNIQYYGSMSILFFVSIPVVIFYLFLSGSKRENLTIYIIFLILTYLLYFILFETYNIHDWEIHYNWPPLLQSFTRYIMPLFVSTMPIFAIFVQKVSNFNNLRILVAFILVVSSITYILSFDGLFAIWELQNEERVIRSTILDETETDSIIIMGYMERAIFPDRAVIPLERISGADDKEKITRLADLSCNLLSNNHVLYIYNYHHEFIDDYKLLCETFDNRGIQIKEVKRNGPFGKLYKISLI